MKAAIEWLNEVGETVAAALFAGQRPPGIEVEKLIKRIQDDARAELRIRLEHEDFRLLVAGKEVAKPGVRMILADIGFDVMFGEIIRAADNVKRP